MHKRVRKAKIQSSTRLHGPNLSPLQSQRRPDGATRLLGKMSGLHVAGEEPRKALQDLDFLKS